MKILIEKASIKAISPVTKLLKKDGTVNLNHKSEPMWYIELAVFKEKLNDFGKPTGEGTLYHLKKLGLDECNEIAKSFMIADLVDVVGFISSSSYTQEKEVEGIPTRVVNYFTGISLLAIQKSQ